MIKLDKIDRSILSILQEDAKTDVKDIACQLNLTKTPVYERIKRLEKEGVLQKYVAILDRAKIKGNMIAFCYVSLDLQSLDMIENFKKAVIPVPEVMECYLLGGEHDFLLKIVVEDLDAYYHFTAGILAALPHVSQIKSSFVLNEVKHSTVLPKI